MISSNLKGTCRHRYRLTNCCRTVQVVDKKNVHLLFVHIQQIQCYFSLCSCLLVSLLIHSCFYLYALCDCVITASDGDK